MSQGLANIEFFIEYEHEYILQHITIILEQVTALLRQLTTPYDGTKLGGGGGVKVTSSHSMLSKQILSCPGESEERIWCWSKTEENICPCQGGDDAQCAGLAKVLKENSLIVLYCRSKMN